MTSEFLSAKAERYLHRLCVDIPSRRTGSAGNREATDFFFATTGVVRFCDRSTSI